MPRPSVIASPEELIEIWPDLHDVALIGLDLREAQLDWSSAQLRSTLLMGCLLADGEIDRLAARGAIVLSKFSDPPFDPYRKTLYTYDELTSGHEAGAHATLDARIGAWFTGSSTSLHDAAVCALHDATMLIAVEDTPPAVVTFIRDHDPDATGRVDIDLRRAHQDR